MSEPGPSRLMAAACASVVIHALVGVAVWYAPPVEPDAAPGLISAISIVPMSADRPPTPPSKPAQQRPARPEPERQAPPPAQPPTPRLVPVPPPEPPKISIGDGDAGSKSRSPLSSTLEGEHVARPSDQDQPSLSIKGGPNQPAMPAVQPSPQPAEPSPERATQSKPGPESTEDSPSAPPADPDGVRTPPETIPGPSAGPMEPAERSSPTPTGVVPEAPAREPEEAPKVNIAPGPAVPAPKLPEPAPVGPEREAQPAQAPPVRPEGAGHEVSKPAPREGAERAEVVASRPLETTPAPQPQRPVKPDPTPAPGASTPTDAPISLDSPAIRLALSLAGVPVGPLKTAAAEAQAKTAASVPKPPSPTPASQPAPAAPALAGLPGVKSNKDSDAFSVRVTGEYRNGRIFGAEGLDIRPVRPQLSLVTRSLTGARRVVVEVQFLKDGTVKSARIVETSGLVSEIDEPVLNAMYAWTASGPALRELPDRPGAYVLLTIAITVR